MLVHEPLSHRTQQELFMLASFRGDFAGDRASEPKLAPFRVASAVALRCCIFSIVLGNAAHLSAADETSEASAAPQRSSLFRLPGFLKRDRDTKPAAMPAQTNRFIARATQLLSQAAAFEANGKPEAALAMARRAESVIRTTSQTTGAQWPSNTQSPSQYIAALKQRTGVVDKTSSSIVDPQTFVPGKPRPLAPSPLPTTESPGPTAAILAEQLGGHSAAVSKTVPRSQKPTSPPVLPSLAQQVGSGRPLLNWGNRFPTSKIQLIGATQTAQPASTSDGPTDETRLLIHQLGELETWSPIAPPTGEGSDLRNRDVVQRNVGGPATRPSPPMVIPDLIDRPDGIDDQNVAPIPTRPTDAIEGSESESVTTTIPVVPDSSDQSPPSPLPQNETGNGNRESANAAQSGDLRSNVYDATPQLLTHTNDATFAATTRLHDNSASVWQLATAQLAATFLGIVLAVCVFLLVRVAAVKLFGTRLGVTFHIGSTESASSESKGDNEAADVVPFGVKSSYDTAVIPNQQTEETKRAGGVADPADFPFRVVGSPNGDDDSAAEGDLNQQQETAILRTVFDHNIDLMSELDKRNESAA
jgi:hypothetical protein